MSPRDEDEVSPKPGGITTSGFARALAEGFGDPAVRRGIARMSRKGFGCTIGDGTAVCLEDTVRVPVAMGGARAGRSGSVVLLGEDGLGLRFGEPHSGIRREFFTWVELDGAPAVGVERGRKRKFATPPRTR